jgi:anti-anti-sigma factor
MQIKNEVRDGIDIVCLKGRIDAKSAPEVHQKIGAVIDNGNDKMLLDCQELEYISSAGLRVLITVAKRLKTAQGRLVLCNLDEKVYEVFEMAGFTAIFEIFSSEEEALSTLRT